MSVETTAALRIDDLFYAYPPLTAEAEAPPVLRGVRLSLPEGERGMLLGRTGVGKTTLLLSTVGIVPQRTGGTCRGRTLVFGLDARYTPVPDLATHVGFLFQDPEAQLFQVRVDDEVAFALENLGLPEDEITRRVYWALELVGLTELAHRRPSTLSGGQKQRLALAAVLAMRPRMLVLDEPTANLDPAGREELLDVLPAIMEEERTLFLATQEVDWAVTLATQGYVLEEGQFSRSGSPRSLFSAADTLLAAGIPVPQVTQAAHRLRVRGIPSPSVLTVAEAIDAWQRMLAAPAPALSPEPSPPTGAAAVASPPWPAIEGMPITVDDVYYAYPDGTQALRGVTLHIEPGERVALIGANGAGKSTLARHMNGLLHPQRGHVRVGPMDTRDVPVHQLARYVGYAFQNPDHQIFAPTVWEEIAFGPRTLGFAADEVRHRVEDMLRLFDLEAYRQVPPAMLGVGLRRKVALASVLVSRPPVIILDEPTGGLDPATVAELLSRIDAFQRAGHTVIFITHDMRLVAEWAQRAVVMAEGRILFDGAPRALFQQADVLARAQLLPPPIHRVASALAPYGMPRDVLTVEEFVDAFMRLYRSRGAS